MPLASISMTGSSAYASSIGWASRWSRRGPDAQFSKWWPIPWGDHQVGCGGNGDRIHRHDSVRDALFSAAQTAALAPRKEVPYLDVHVISTLQRLTLKEAAVTQGHALSVGEERKRAAHSEACHDVGVTFIPMVVETLGRWGEEAALTVKIIGRLQGLRLGIPPAQATRYLFQRLAINLWRGNATLWIRRLPT